LSPIPVTAFRCHRGRGSPKISAPWGKGAVCSSRRPSDQEQRREAEEGGKPDHIGNGGQEKPAGQRRVNTEAFERQRDQGARQRAREQIGDEREGDDGA
jgi:hypothetical protein